LHQKRWGINRISNFDKLGLNVLRSWHPQFQAEFIGKLKIRFRSHSDAIFSLGPSLQALLENAFSPKPAFSKQGAGTRIKF
jgi:hypothetical protein